MYSDWSVIPWVVMAVFFIWLGILTFLVFRQADFLKSLFPKSGERDIRKKFSEVLKEVSDFKIYFDKLDAKLVDLENQGLGHIQRVELLRYNPYEDTGGDQSFTIALLNKKGSGIVMTSLHARSTTRVFAKLIVEGKSKYHLSKEEEETVKKAINNV